MSNQNIDNMIGELLEQNGIFLEEDMTESMEMDSLTFISIIVGIEESFTVNIPEKYLIEKPDTYQDFFELVYRILNDPESKIL